MMHTLADMSIVAGDGIFELRLDSHDGAKILVRVSPSQAAALGKQLCLWADRNGETSIRAVLLEANPNLMELMERICALESKLGVVSPRCPDAPTSTESGD